MINHILGPFTKYLPENNRLELIWKLAQVDFKKRYYNDKFGILWALINPLTQIFIYYFVFTRILQRGGHIDNFALFLFGGLIMWTGFIEATIKGSRILKQKRYLIENIQFNWLDLYYAHMISIIMGLLFNLSAYVFVLKLSGVAFGDYTIYLPIVLVTWAMLSYSMSILLSLIIPIYEDMVHIWNIYLMIGFWTTGIFFSGTFYLDNYPIIGHLNPFIGIVLNTRAGLLENNEFFPALLFDNFIMCFILFIFSTWVFKKYATSIIERL